MCAVDDARVVAVGIDDVVHARVRGREDESVRVREGVDGVAVVVVERGGRREL